MESLDDILKLRPTQFDTHWAEIDQIVGGLPSFAEKVSAWKAIVRCLGLESVSKGHPYFRLGTLHLSVPLKGCGRPNTIFASSVPFS